MGSTKMAPELASNWKQEKGRHWDCGFLFMQFSHLKHCEDFHQGPVRCCFRWGDPPVVNLPSWPLFQMGRPPKVVTLSTRLHYREENC